MFCLAHDGMDNEAIAIAPNNGNVFSNVILKKSLRVFVLSFFMIYSLRSLYGTTFTSLAATIIAGCPAAILACIKATCFTCTKTAIVACIIASSIAIGTYSFSNKWNVSKGNCANDR